MEKGEVLYLNKLESPSPRVLCAKFGWKLAWWFWSRRFLNFVKVFSLFRNYLKTWILCTQGCFVSSLVEIGSVVPEKKMKMWNVYDNEKCTIKSEMFMKIYWMDDIKINFDNILSEISFAYGVIKMWVLYILRRGGCENAKGYKENSAPHLINEDWCSYPDLRIALIIGHCILWSSIFCPKHRAVNAVIFFWCPVFSIRQCMVWSSIFCCSVIITGQCMLKSSLFCCSVLIIVNFILWSSLFCCSVLILGQCMLWSSFFCCWYCIVEDLIQ